MKKPQAEATIGTAGQRSRIVQLAFGTALGAAALLAAIGAAQASEIAVSIDQAKTLRLEHAVTTVSVGNPAIADVAVQDGKLLFVLGRSFGRTNLVGLDNTGQTVLDMTIFVTQPATGAVTVYRGSRQVSYNCAPNCERALLPGDAKDDFETLSGQISTKVDISKSSSGAQ